MQAHCKFVSGSFSDNITWTIDAVTMNVTHIRLGCIAPEVGMASHDFLTTLDINGVCRHSEMFFMEPLIPDPRAIEGEDWIWAREARFFYAVQINGSHIWRAIGASVIKMMMHADSISRAKSEIYSMINIRCNHFLKLGHWVADQ
jgi:hypothetical protein